MDTKPKVNDILKRYNEFEKTIVDKLKSSDDKEYKIALVEFLTAVNNVVYGGAYVNTLCNLSNKYLSTNDECVWKFCCVDEYNTVVRINCLPPDDNIKYYHKETVCPYCGRQIKYIKDKK